MRRIKQSEIKEIRNTLLEQQNYICPLCKTVISESEAVLDHDHETGFVRSVLHRSCNQTEGRIKSWVNRCRADHYVDFLENLIEYLKAPSSEYEHPSLVTDKWKKFKRMKKDQQLQVLEEEFNFVPENTHSKDQLLKVYKKLLRKKEPTVE